MKYESTTNRITNLMLGAPRRLLNRANGFSSTHNNHGFNRQNTFKISPTTFGGDPSGLKDSTAALQKCVAHCVNQSSLSPNGVFPGTYSFHNGKSIRDMGGCFIDLEGGEYRISSPITIPEYNANMHLGFGSIVAGPTFPTDEFLIVIGKKGSCKVPQGSCNIDINFPLLFLDGGNRGSCLQINNVMGVTIGPDGYFLNFTKFGVQINGGHEVMMDRCWLGETNFDFDFAAQKVVPNATAVQINGNDHYILNTIIFSSRIGLEVNGAADYVTGVHVWFPYNRALSYDYTMAFHITRSGNRFNGCYADGGRVVFEGSGLSRNIWTNGFECCAGSGLGHIPHGIILRGSTNDVIGSGLQIFANEFGGGNIWYEAPKKRNEGDCDLPQNLTGQWCNGLKGQPAAKTPEECKQSCCNDLSNCEGWQWCGKNEKCFATLEDGIQCWTGVTNDCQKNPTNPSGIGWVGSGSNSPHKLIIKDVIINRNSFTDSKGRGTRASKSITLEKTTSWFFDFCSELLFPQIASVRFSLQASTKQTQFVRAMASPAENCTVTILTDEPFSGTVTVDVDSSTYTNGLV